MNKTAGAIALGVILALGQAAVVLLVHDMRQDLRELRAASQGQAVVIGSLVTWAESKGYRPFN